MKMHEVSRAEAGTTVSVQVDAGQESGDFSGGHLDNTGHGGRDAEV
jgi:hypothetical protein